VSEWGRAATNEVEAKVSEKARDGFWWLDELAYFKKKWTVYIYSWAW